MAWLMHVFSTRTGAIRGSLVAEDHHGHVIATSPALRYMQGWDTLTVSLWLGKHRMSCRSERLYERCECRRCKDAMTSLPSASAHTAGAPGSRVGTNDTAAPRSAAAP